MDNQAQLSWEARFGRIAAASAFLSIVAEVTSSALQISASSGAPSRDDPLRYSGTLLNFHDHSGTVLASAIAHGVAAIFAAGALFYLFRATRHRRAQLPQIVQWLIPLAPVLITVAAIANWSGLNDAADKYESPSARAAIKATPNKDQREDIAKYCRDHARGTDAIKACESTRGRQEAVAKKLVQDNQGALGAGALFAGTVALAFAFVIIALNAMRAGLLSRFMGILGIIAGALIVLPLIPGIPVVQIFWLGAVGALYLGVWPGGRGPAWETGEDDPWPTPQARIGLPEDEEEGSDEPDQAEEPEPEEEPAKPHPASKKRKRKRKR